jgi:hypothetical protein
MGLSSSRGKMVIIGGSGGIFGIFSIAGGSWHKKTGAYVKFGNFSGFLWNFGGFRTDLWLVFEKAGPNYEISRAQGLWVNL